MKQQTYIAKIETVDGRMIDFYRFGVKNASRIKKTMFEAASQEFFRRTWKRDGGEIVKLYATPDGYTEAKPEVWSFKIDEVPARGY